MNILLSTDVYKLGHMQQYAPGTTKVYSYLTTRSDKNFKFVKWFGLKYYIEKYINKPINPIDGLQFIAYYERILGACPVEVKDKIESLVALGYWPLEIKELEEGKEYPIKTALMTITNTLPDFYWCVGFVESLLLKVWYPSTVATCSMTYRKIVDKYFYGTCSEENYVLKDFMVHDFGYRGDTSEESAGLSGMSHLLNFKGSDTLIAQPYADAYYPELQLSMGSVPASEHSVMCSYGRFGELDAIRELLHVYPNGIVSIVADTYDLWKFINEYLPLLKDRILARDGKVVIRPDSGDPEKIICGDPFANNPVEKLGVLESLGNIFGTTINSKGYKELNPKIGLIYGDGMYLERYERTLERMKQNKWAASNLVVGIGGILRNHSRDTLGFAIKATYVEVKGEAREIMKDPVTDKSKRSHCGLIMVDENLVTHDRQNKLTEQNGLLKTIYKNGGIKIEKNKNNHLELKDVFVPGQPDYKTNPYNK